VQVDLLDGELSGLDLLRKHFNLRLGGPGLLKGSCRVLGKPSPNEREAGSADVDSADVEVASDTGGTDETGETGERIASRELYDGIVVMKPFGQNFRPNPSISSISSILPGEGPGQHQEHQVKSPLPLRTLRKGGLLLVEATPEDRNQLEKLGEVLELNDLLQVQLKLDVIRGMDQMRMEMQDCVRGYWWILVDTEETIVLYCIYLYFGFPSLFGTRFWGKCGTSLLSHGSFHCILF